MLSSHACHYLQRPHSEFILLKHWNTLNFLICLHVRKDQSLMSALEAGTVFSAYRKLTGVRALSVHSDVWNDDLPQQRCGGLSGRCLNVCKCTAVVRCGARGFP